MIACLMEFLHNINAEVDQVGAYGVIFLDLTKACDIVDLKLLITQKLRFSAFKNLTRK